jgi:HD-like signal output (HDOD) protein/CheY-like chemotaxis protein
VVNLAPTELPRTASSPRRILFVDDDEQILAALRNALRKERHRWDMRFALGGEAALAALAARPVDVIVSDMRMPGMDGPELLARVKLAHPTTIRVALSGQADRDAVMRAVPVTHQFLMKPCDSETLRGVIERACELQRFLLNDVVRAAVGRIEKLPSVPRTYAEITAALADPEVGLTALARIVERDPAVSAKVLQLANSAFFGLAQPTRSVERAVIYLGADLLRGLALECGLLADVGTRVEGLSLERLHDRSLLVARMARRFLQGRPEANEAFTAGIVHDLGTVILAMGLGEAFAEIGRRARQSGVPLRESELRTLGVTHAEVGAYLLGTWGLPAPILEAVAHHHTPGAAGDGPHPVLAAVHVAGILADASLGVEEGTDGEIDAAFLDRAGLAGELPRWRALAQQEIGAARAS